MADFTLSTQLLIDLWPVLQGVEVLSPPPNAKGRYALAKATSAAKPAVDVASGQLLQLMRRCAKVDKDGNPLLKQEGNRVTCDVRPEVAEEYQRESKAILDEPVTLTGVRAITRAELGDCPITVQHERVLIACGLLPDEEPA